MYIRNKTKTLIHLTAAFGASRRSFPEEDERATGTHVLSGESAIECTCTIAVLTRVTPG